MQQTTKYQFKLIEGSDDFSTQPLNDNVEKVEELLTELETAYSPNNKPFVVGRYQGTGSSAPTTVTLGFRPSMLIITGTETNGTLQESIITDGTKMSYRLELTNTGFIAYQPGENAHDYPDLNKAHFYAYIAFR